MSVFGKHVAAPGLRRAGSAAQGWRRSAALAAIVAIALLHGLLLYSSAGYDDSHITYWAAYALSTFGDIVNYNGARIEQSSSLLLVVILAGLHRLFQADLASLGALTSMASGALALVLACLLARRLGLAATWRVALILALSPQLVFWSYSGMEAPLAAACVVWFLLAVLDGLHRGLSPLRLGHLLLAALPLFAVRPESFFVAIAFLGGLLICLWPFGWLYGALRVGRRAVAIRLVAMIASLCLAFALLAGWRYFYFGSAVPQPVQAKVGGDLLDELDAGASYLLLQIRSMTLVVILFLTISGLVRALARRADERVAFALLFLGGFAAAQCAFILFSGGDWMSGARFLVPVIPLLAVSALLGLDLMFPGGGRARAFALAAILALVMFDTATFVLRLSTGVPLAITGLFARDVERYLPPGAHRLSWFETANLIHLRDAWPTTVLDGVVGDLHRAENRRITVMTGQTGMIAFHLVSRRYGEVEIVGRRGLITDRFNDCAEELDLPSDRFGLVITYQDLFRDRPQIWTRCNLARPDVIFDLVPYDGGPDDYLPIGLLQQTGYTLIYVQYGPVQVGWSRAFQAEEAIMVRNDLVHLVDPARFVQHFW